VAKDRLPPLLQNYVISVSKAACKKTITAKQRIHARCFMLLKKTQVTFLQYTKKQCKK
jgi:hypothetical protein